MVTGNHKADYSGLWCCVIM